MPRRYFVVRAAIVAAIAGLFVALAIVQFASYALDARAAVQGSLPSRVPIGFGLAVYRALDRVAPAPFVESTLRGTGVGNGRLRCRANGMHFGCPSSPTRDELLAQTARARGDTTLAFEYDLAAPDVEP